MTTPSEYPEEREADDADVVLMPTRYNRLTDMGNAERFAQQHGANARYCHQWRVWLAWDGRRWRRDNSAEIRRKAKATIRSIYAEAASAEKDSIRGALVEHAKKSEKTSAIRAMLEQAQCEVPVEPRELDAHPWLLNVANGTVDLRTGKLGPHRREDLLTRLSPVRYDPNARSEVFDRFLDDLSQGDAALLGFLQRVAGYCATGLTDEKHFFFAFGPPGTGKSTFLDAVSAALGEYAVTSAPETWLRQTTIGGNRGDLVRLFGSRLATTSEFKEGTKFDESLIKGITGGDALTAAAKYEQEFEFRPTFKLLFAANDAPRIADTDAGMWARCLRIPFDCVVPPERRDPGVKRRLCDPTDAGPAILAWIVRGCLEWQTSGLSVPACVTASTEAYRRDNDPAGDFFADCLVFAADAWVAASEITRAYVRWAEMEGIRHPLSPTALARRLEERGCSRKRTNRERLWQGVRTRYASETSDE